MRKPVKSTLTEKVLARSLPAWLALTIALALAPGCTRHVFMTEKVYEDATHRLSYELENNPTAGVAPVSAPVAAPPIVDFPERPPRFMTLPEAIAICLENGNVSGNLGQGLSDDSLVGLGRGPLNAQSQRVRVLALAPAVAETNIEASLARFDAKWITTVGWTTTDNLVNGLADFQNGTSATVNSTVVKAFSGGGVMNVSLGALNPGPFSGSYTNLRNPPNGVINNVYNMPVTVGFEQPLWQNFGVGINQLLNQVAPIQGITMPGQAAAYFNNNSRLPLTQGPNFAGLATQGILLARLQFDLQRAEFEQQINHLLENTEVAYWRLYQAYGQLYSWDEALKTALTGWRFTKLKTQQELEGTGAQELFLTQALYEEFRGERLKALGQVLDAERNLRGILGMIEDGTRIVPITAPTVAPYQPNWDAAVQDAIALRPELVMARENLRNLQFNLEITKNFLKPDVRGVGFIQPTGWGTRLDGNGTMNESINGTIIPRTNNALRSLARADWNNWTVGLTCNIPLGWRLEHAAVRSARLQLAQAYYVLQDQEEKAKRALEQHYQKVNEYYRRIEIARAERKAYEQTVKAYWKLIETQFGKQFSPGNQAVVDAERRLALARLKEYEAIAEYNSSLCRFEWAKGTIQQYDNVVIAEGALPQIVETRAVEHERMRSQAIVLQERARGPGPVAQPGISFQENQFPGGAATPRDADDLRPEAIPVQPRELKKRTETIPVLPSETRKPATTPAKENLAPGKQPTLPSTQPGKSETPKAGPRSLEIPAGPAGSLPPSRETPSSGSPGTIVMPENTFPGLSSVPQQPASPDSFGRPITAPPTTAPALPGSPIGPPPPFARPN